MKDQKEPKNPKDQPNETWSSSLPDGTSPEVENRQGSESAEAPNTGETLEALRCDLEAKTQDAQANHDKYLRLAAEFENYKRRTQRDQSDAIRFANEKLLKDLLPTLDNLERAIQCGREQSASGGLLEGVELTQKQFLETLNKLGVQQISSIGEQFDPGKHQAVAQVDSDTVPTNAVVEEFQKGYFLHERILRPAMVTVAKEKSQQHKHSTSTSDERSDEGGTET